MHAALFRKPTLLALAAVLALALSTAVAARPPAEDGAIQIRSNAIVATSLPAASLRALDIEDPAHTGLLNVVALRRKHGIVSTVPAEVRARAMREDGSPVAVDLREMRDRGGVSYLGIFPLRHGGRLRFDIDVTPVGKPTRHLHYEHTFVMP